MAAFASRELRQRLWLEQRLWKQLRRQQGQGTGLTTSATGAACCLRAGSICSCYDQLNVGSCTGFPSVTSCTFGAVTPCSDPLSQGEHSVASCR